MPAPLHAWLGPTNTGKTHRAVERMIQFESGMIGLPLRLLAREVYDRMTTRLGEAQVALVTGEERRVPRTARFFVCTVEAMPVERPVECVVIDEVQLAADRGRGHVFTDRILHLRGTRETIFCGADTIAPLLRRLLPNVVIDGFPRLSQLSHAGHHRIGQLPPRTALIAFSAEDVYALAERVRRRHGGAAVVLGALSPRARNAQAALFQSGEVPYLVATDAIGMGLNLDVAHVAFSATRKFDGVEIRRLRPAELAQIAGRAGRHVQDGTFGTAEDEPVLTDATVRAIEDHDFPPLRRLFWRAHALHFDSLAALGHSLRAPPPNPALERVAPDEDELAFDTLSRHPEVRLRAVDEAHVRLLWDVCRVPDYRKGGDHAEMLRRIYVRLCDQGALAANWVLQQVERLQRVDGEIEELMQRVSWVRTWTYVSHHDGWVQDAPAVAATARAVEDLLSDALHQRLTERFIDRRARIDGGVSAALEGDVVRIGGRRVGELQGLVFVPDVPGDVPRAVGGAVAERLEARVRELVEAPHGAFTVTDEEVRWLGGALARWVPGPTLREPGLRLVRNGLLGPAHHSRVQRRLDAWLRDELARIFAPLRDTSIPHGAARGVMYALEEGLGTCPAPIDLDAPARRALAAAGVRLGVEYAYSMPMLDRVADRARLWAIAAGRPSPTPPDAPIARSPLPADALRALGYIAMGPIAVRVDHYESLMAILRTSSKRGPFATPPALVGFEDALRSTGWEETPAGWIRRRRR